MCYTHCQCHENKATNHSPIPPVRPKWPLPPHRHPGSWWLQSNWITWSLLFSKFGCWFLYVSTAHGATYLLSKQSNNSSWRITPNAMFSAHDAKSFRTGGLVSTTGSLQKAIAIFQPFDHLTIGTINFHRSFCQMSNKTFDTPFSLPVRCKPSKMSPGNGSKQVVSSGEKLELQRQQLRSNAQRQQKLREELAKQRQECKMAEEELLGLLEEASKKLKTCCCIGKMSSKEV